MKILQLNTWTGRLEGTLKDFFANNDFDLICLQEAVWSDNKLLETFCVTVDQIKELGGLKYDFRSANWAIDAFDSKIYQGNVILSREKILKKDCEVTFGEILELRRPEDTAKQRYTIQIIKLKNGLNVINHHGYWLPTPIGDENTIRSMRKAASFIKKIEGSMVMCGDLNIIHEAPAMRELDFLRDLTYEFNIDNTLVGLKFNGKVPCDHILVSKDIEVKNFTVLDNIISDHKGLVAEIKF